MNQWLFYLLSTHVGEINFAVYLEYEKKHKQNDRQAAETCGSRRVERENTLFRNSCTLQCCYRSLLFNQHITLFTFGLVNYNWTGEIIWVFLLKALLRYQKLKSKGAEMFGKDMERFLYWEDNAASFPLSAARDTQFTFLLAWSHVHSAIVQSPKGPSDPDREQAEKSGPLWTVAKLKRARCFNMGRFRNIELTSYW